MPAKPTVLKRALVACGTVAGLLGLAVAPAFASSASYGVWDIQPGELTVAATNFPTGHFSAANSSLRTASGSSAFLNASTPFGQAFGTSQNQPYLLALAARNSSLGIMTLTFPSPPAAGTWGFALGDVDAENVTVHAYDASGDQLPASALGWQSSFNYCQGSPMPSSCRGAQTDIPTWNAGNSTLLGNGSDTNGAAGWFHPTAAVKSLVFHEEDITGIPAYQLWIAGTAQPDVPGGPETPKPITANDGQVVIPPPSGVGPLPIVTIVHPPKHGSIQVETDGSLHYTADAGFVGTETFTVLTVSRDHKVIVERTYTVIVPPRLPNTGADGVAALLVTGVALVGGGGVLRRLARQL